MVFISQKTDDSTPHIYVLNSVFVKGVVSFYLFLRYKLEIVGGMGPTVGKVRF